MAMSESMMRISHLLMSRVVLLSVISACVADKGETPPPNPPLLGMPMQGYMMGPGMMGPGIREQVVPEPQSTGAKLVKQYCIQCHGLPSPAQHTADAWSAVVPRMQGHMRETSNNGKMPIRIPSQSTIKEIIDYLQKHAS